MLVAFDHFPKSVVTRGTISQSRHQKIGGICGTPTELLRIHFSFRAPCLSLDNLTHFIPSQAPMLEHIDFSQPLRYFQPPIHSSPAEQLRKRIMSWLRTKLPDSTIGPIENHDCALNQLNHTLERTLEIGSIESTVEEKRRYRHYHFSVDIILGMCVRGVAYTHGAEPVKALEPGKLDFVKFPLAPNSIHGLKLFSRLIDRNIVEVLDESLDLIELAELI